MTATEYTYICLTRYIQFCALFATATAR
uniref:Uncharacterized protein n=1 Tax=Anguilla anguilla TaxID=7936 RepID=A0A0E9SBL7_ANGAN